MAVLTRKVSADEAMSLRRDQLRGDRLLKVASAAPSSWDAGARSARFVMTSQAPDRYGDLVMTNGIDVVEFMRNPVGFLSHNSASWAVGKWQGLQKYLHATPPRMEGTLQLGPSGGPIEAVDQAAWSLEHGLLRAASIGFLPDWSACEKVLNANGAWDGGLVFHQTELLECSLCGVPANPQALAKGLAANPSRDTRDFEDWLRTPDGEKIARQRMREIEVARLKRGGRHGAG